MTDDEGATSFDPTVATLQNISEDVEKEFFDCEPITDKTPLIDSGGVQKPDDLSEFLDPYPDPHEQEQEEAVVVLKLYRELLDSEDDVDV